MKYLNNLDANFLLTFARKFFKDYYNSDNIYVEKVGNSCVVKCFVNNKHTLIISLKDFDVECKDILCKQLAKMQWQKALVKHFGEKYLMELKESMGKGINKEHDKNIARIDREINRLKTEIVR